MTTIEFLQQLAQTTHFQSSQQLIDCPEHLRALIQTKDNDALKALLAGDQTLANEIEVTHIA